MGFYEDRLLPRFIDVALGSKKLGPLRQRALNGISGTVLEIGFGSGTNLAYYPTDVTRLLAVDPAKSGRDLARKRLAASSLDVEFIGLDGQSLPLDDNSVDNVASTWTLCTIPDVDSALREIHRVLRPGGRLYFLEHGLSPDPKLARRQHRFDPIEQKIAGGCHVNRDHRALLDASPLEVERVDNFMIAGPKMVSYMYAGTAIRD